MNFHYLKRRLEKRYSQTRLNPKKMYEKRRFFWKNVKIRVTLFKRPYLGKFPSDFHNFWIFAKLISFAIIEHTIFLPKGIFYRFKRTEKIKFAKFPVFCMGF
jgi:hypothetical protein